MDFIVVGAGSVGAVVGSLLQQQSEHHVYYWARAARADKPRPRKFELQRISGRASAALLRAEPLTWIDANTQPLPASDWVLVCVRTEQLSAALHEVATQLGPERAVAIATVTIDGALATARSAGLKGPVLAFHVSFGSGHPAHDASQFWWFPFSPPSMISADGQPELLALAAALARVLDRAGLPTRSTLSMAGMMQLMMMATAPLLPSWELCNWNIAELASDRDLRLHTARAMHETMRRFPPERGLPRALALHMPQAFFTVLLSVLPWLMGERARTLWLAHGPKISAQTGFVLDTLLERAASTGAPLTQLAQLAARWRAQQRPPMAASGAHAAPANGAAPLHTDRVRS